MSLFGFGSSPKSDDRTTRDPAYVAPIEYTIGDKVELIGTGKTGLVRFIGKLPGQEGAFVGLELSQPQGNSDGSKDGQEFFKCKKNFGLFLPINSCSKSKNQSTVKTPSKTTPSSKKSEAYSFPKDTPTKVTTPARSFTRTPVNFSSSPQMHVNTSSASGNYADIVMDLQARVCVLESKLSESEVRIGQVLFCIRELKTASSTSSRGTRTSLEQDTHALERIYELAKEAQRSLSQ